MIDVNIVSPDTLEELFEIVEVEPRRVYYLAGGTDLVIRAKDGQIRDAVFVNIKRIGELKGIEKKDDYIRIGAAVLHSELVESDLIREYAPVLALAASEVGSVQIRNLGTIGGNVGNASPAGDTIPALYVLDADVVLINAKGERVVKIYDFIQGPGKIDLREGELIREFRIPLKYKDYQAYFKKLGQRRALAISKINIAVNLLLGEDKVIKDVKIALGAVAPTVVRALKTEEFLLYKVLDEQIALQAEEIITQEVTPIDDVRSTAEYRREMARVLLRKVLREASV